MPNLKKGCVMFVKAKVPSYTKKDGTFVSAYTSRRVAKPHPRPPMWHPCPNDKGRLTVIAKPHAQSDTTSWFDPAAKATFVPGGDHPHALGGVAVSAWDDAPETPKDWNRVEGQAPSLQEPPLPDLPEGKIRGAGVVVVEPDGRVWTVSPSNRFGGYKNTFPKGGAEEGVNLQATAIKEAYEESGLKVAITGYLTDVERTTSMVRYYRAERVGGDPTEMGWESQAVHLVPISMIGKHAKHENDAPIIEALLGK